MRPFIGMDDGLIESILPRIIRESWTARYSEQFVNNLRQSGTKTLISPGIVVESTYQPDIKRLAKRFVTDIHVKTSKKGNGQIIIDFKDEKDFYRIQSMLEK
jgi:ParB family chromosome partitioning protein